MPRHTSMTFAALAIATIGACQTTTSTSTSDTPPAAPEASMEPTPELSLATPTTSPTSSIDAEGLTTQLVPNPDGYAAGDPITLTFVVRNPGDADRTFCDYHTPFEGIRNDLFELRDASGAEVPYEGKMAKRAPPSADDYLLVRSGTRAEVTFDLSTAYSPTSGDYTIRFAGNDISGLPASDTVTITVP